MHLLIDCSLKTKIKILLFLLITALCCFSWEVAEDVLAEDVVVEDAGEKININKEESITATYSVMNQKATVKLKNIENKPGIKLLYQKGNIQDTEDASWIEKGKDFSKKQSFKVKKAGKYSILSEYEGVKKICQVDVTLEMKAVWLAYVEYNANGYTKKKFKKYINKVMDNCKKKHINTVFMHVRPMADAMYDSKYFPWSKYASGKNGKNPGYDPLELAIDAAHKRGIELHAWINPYRVSKDASIKKLSKNSIARKWATSKNKSKRRNVLYYGGIHYFNPSKAEVRKLVVNGVKEIVENYDIDGIHFDDYFYPNLGTQYKRVFDAKEYNAYAKKCKKSGKKPVSIVKWRRNNVNLLVSEVYKAIKEIDEDCVFGISPAGNLDSLYAKNNYYSDVKKWMKNDGYIDYICPQIYWSLTQKICPFKKTLNKWKNIKRSNSVKLYVGLASYRAGLTKQEAKAIGDPQWGKKRNVLKQELEYARKTKKVDGFSLYSYSDLTRSTAKKEIDNLMKIIDKK